MNHNRLKDKTVLITGSSSGIGKACAVALYKQGAKLILHGRNRKKLEALLTDEKLEATLLVFDVRDKDAITKELDTLLTTQQVDILINNAGLALGLEPLDAGDINAWEEMIDANIKGLLYVSRAVIPHMRKQNSGHIVNIGSIAGVMAYPGGNVYCATKAAVHSLSQSMNIDLADTPIRVSNVAPGAVETNFSPTRFKGDTQKVQAVYAGYQPLSAEDVADMVVYILNAPEHVNVQDVLIMPTAQRNPYVLHRT